MPTGLFLFYFIDLFAVWKLCSAHYMSQFKSMTFNIYSYVERNRNGSEGKERDRDKKKNFLHPEYFPENLCVTHLHTSKLKFNILT